MAETIRLTGLDEVLKLLKELPAEVVSKNGGPVRFALRKGAAVIHKQAKANLAQSTEGQESTGLLLKNLVITRGKGVPSGKGERMLVRVRRKSYQRKGAAVTTLKTAQLLEYGSSQQPAEPWLRPAFSATAQKSIETVQTELVKKLDSIVKKLGSR